MPAVRLGFAALTSHADTFVRADFLGGQMVSGSYATYVAGFTQFDVFAIGALLQFHFHRLPRFNTAAAIWALLLVMVLLGRATAGSAYGALWGPFLGAPGAHQYAWGYSLIALLGGLLVIHFSALPATSPLSRALGRLLLRVLYPALSSDRHLRAVRVVRFAGDKARRCPRLPADLRLLCRLAPPRKRASSHGTWTAISSASLTRESGAEPSALLLAVIQTLRPALKALAAMRARVRRVSTSSSTSLSNGS